MTELREIAPGLHRWTAWHEHSSLGKASHAELRASLRRLLELPVRHVLPSHGEPVLRVGRRYLEALLA